MDVAQLGGAFAVALTVLGALAVFASNVLYSRPRIEAQTKRIRDLEDDARTTAAQLAERDKRVTFLEEMVKSVPAFVELVRAIESLQATVATELQAHEHAAEARENAVVTALEAIVAKLGHA